MRKTIAALLITGTLAGCYYDLTPEYRDEELSIRAGGEKTRSVYSEWDTYDNLRGWWQDIGDLPPGFHYETLGVSVGDAGYVEVLYRIAVDRDVPTGWYGFGVEYEMLETGLLSIEKIRFDFHVRVRPPRQEKDLVPEVGTLISEERTTDPMDLSITTPQHDDG